VVDAQRPESHLENRRRRLEKRHRYILLASLGAAALIHAAVFALNPSGDIEVGRATSLSPVDFRVGVPRDVWLDAAPLSAKSALSARVSNMVAARVALLREPAMPHYRAYGEAGVVAVRVDTGPSGEVNSATLVEGTGDATFDAIFVRLAQELQFTLDPAPQSAASFTIPISIGPVESVVR